MKKVFSMLFSIILLVCILYFIKTNWNKISAAIQHINKSETYSEVNSEVNSEAVSQTQPENTTYSDNVSMQIDQSQICGMETPVIIENTSNHQGNKLQYTFSNVKISRQLDDRFKSRMISRALLEQHAFFSYSVMSDDYTFYKDFYYLYITVNVKNVSKDTVFVINELKYVLYDNGKMSSIGTDTLYNDSKYDAAPCAYLETDDKKLLFKGVIKNFFSGDDMTYDACYMITDDTVNKNNVYFVDQYGMRPENAFKNAEQKYIKVDIGG